MRTQLIALIVLTGSVCAIAATQPVIVTPNIDPFDGLRPDARVMAFLKATESPNQSGSCRPGSSEANCRNVFPGWTRSSGGSRRMC